jgi:GNAT superfamily N-acetyltransferase
LISEKRGQPPRVIEVRDAVREDAPAACEVIRRSISELCEADHRNAPEILRRWLANKTPEIVGWRIMKPGNSVLVALDDDSILAVGSVTDAGEINLNYISPDARFRGVSRAVVTALEARALERGADRRTLLSTETAHRFYESVGYIEDGAPQGRFGTASSYPMSKRLPGHADRRPMVAQDARNGGVRLVRLQPVVDELPADFDTVRAEARAEGYRFLDRLASDWGSGAMRFDRPGEVLLAAYSDGVLAAIGGITIDPIVPDALRMRRFYVRPAFRRTGIGGEIAQALLKSARSIRVVTLNAAVESVPFWEALGFVSQARDGHTHVWRQAEPKR